MRTREGELLEGMYVQYIAYGMHSQIQEFGAPLDTDTDPVTDTEPRLRIL